LPVAFPKPGNPNIRGIHRQAVLAREIGARSFAFSFTYKFLEVVKFLFPRCRRPLGAEAPANLLLRRGDPPAQELGLRGGAVVRGGRDIIPRDRRFVTVS
jgi:hypothetical protein